MNTQKYNIGIAFNLDGMAICHSKANGENLIIIDFWTGKEGKDYTPVSAPVITDQLDKILKTIAIPQSANVDIYIANEILRKELSIWTAKHHKGFNEIRTLTPVCPPSDTAVWIASELHAGRLHITENIDLALIKSAFAGISEDEQGRAIGSPESLALLHGVGEPLARRSRHKGRQLPIETTHRSNLRTASR